MQPDDRHLSEQMSKQIKRLKSARKAGVLGLLVTGGTVGLLLTVPLILGAYLGRWLDEQSPGYSVRWTVNLILLGLAVGIYNVYRFLKEHGQ
ncbi:MAG: AtpZ/AtpI family protein [Burkholderiales bacterium]|nr:AtpZ/AtpI family protein [Burkholderiales bacterium]MDE2431540.1 AtpZ/AtpI family protein [Burkholderiales bacterium]HET8693779.1 AtpZ/AtpI family protein [Aquabacterium sp.]